RSSPFLFGRSDAELNAVCAHLVVELVGVSYCKPQLHGSRNMSLVRWMQCKHCLASGKFAPSERSKLKRQAKYIAIKLHSSVHVRHKFNHIVHLQGRIHVAPPGRADILGVRDESNQESPPDGSTAVQFSVRQIVDV